MRRRIAWMRLALAAASLNLFSCGATTKEGGTEVGGSTHWLQKCKADSECAGDICYAGVCTKACTEDSQCGAKSECSSGVNLLSSAEDLSCATRYSVCFETCKKDSECGSGMACSGGLCLTKNVDCEALGEAVEVIGGDQPNVQPTNTSPTPDVTTDPIPTDVPSQSVTETIPPDVSQSPSETVPVPTTTAPPVPSSPIFGAIEGDSLPMIHYINVIVAEGYCNSNQPDGKNSLLRIHAPDGEWYQYEHNPGESACNDGCASRPVKGSSGFMVQSRVYPFEGLARRLVTREECSPSDAGTGECLETTELTWGEYTVEFCAYPGTLDYPAGTRDVTCVQSDDTPHCATATFNYPEDPDSVLTLDFPPSAE